MDDPDRDLKLMFINRQKRLFANILRQLEAGEKKGVTPEDLVEQFKGAYNSIVYDDAKKAYLEHKLRVLKRKEKYYVDDLFSAKI